MRLCALVAPALALRDQSEQLLREIIERGDSLAVFHTPHPWMTMAAIGGMGIRVASWYHAGSDLSVDDVATTYAELAVRMARG